MTVKLRSGDLRKCTLFHVKTSKLKKMDKNSTLTGKLIMTLAIFTLLSSFSANAGTGKPKAPTFKFNNPILVSGIAGQIGAKYFFKNVYNNKDAVIRIENIVGGAVLKDMDNTTTGYPDAWQPTVGGPGAFGTFYIKWDVEFDSAGVPYVFSLIDLSAADVDGDNVRVRELSGIVGSNINYSLPDSTIPSLLTLSSIKNIDNPWGTDDDDSVFMALGPVANRAGIDTLALDVRVDYSFANRSSFQIYTGAQIDNNGNTGGIATDRFHSIYFGDLTGRYSVLAVKCQNFNAMWKNDAVNLNWTMCSDVTNSHFEIERSFDQKEFKTIGLVMGSQITGNGLSNQNNFRDADNELTAHKEVFYRLKYVDVNGKFSYSIIKKVSLYTSKMSMQVMPNPYMDKLNVNFASDEGGTAEIRLMNASGSMVKRIQSAIVRGDNNLQLQDLNSQAPGFYIVNVIINGKIIESQKLIKQ